MRLELIIPVNDSIRAFLKAKPIPEGKWYALVMDNAPWHKKTMRLISEEAQPECSDIRKKVEFIKLPPYSPDLNPIEQVWRITRKKIRITYSSQRYQS